MPTRFKVPDGGTYEWPLADGVEARFVAKVQKGDEHECWPWLAFCDPSGYGMIRNGTRMALAPRLAWVLERREKIPDGLHVLHHCDRRSCVNPRHLYLGTNADNVRDKVERGRASFPHPERRGELHPMAKLTNEQVRAIRQTATGRRGEGRELAQKYGVSPATICNILRGKSWPI